MQISILIIAHNEENHIRECIESVLHQSIQADEIIFVAHNCTDNTANIAREYPQITLHELQTDETWPIPAREHGFEQATGDIIACIDGDSYACSVWLEELMKPFLNPQIMSVSGYPILVNNWIVSFIFFLQWLPILHNIFDFYFWWSNFACRKSVYTKVGGMSRCREIAKILELHYPAEDCILSFLLQKEGKIWFARKAQSHVYPGGFFENTNRGTKQRQDLRKIKWFFRRISNELFLIK